MKSGRITRPNSAPSVLVLIWLVLFQPLYLSADVDSLKHLVNTTSNIADTTAIRLYIAIGDHYVRGSTDSAKKYFERGLDILDPLLEKTPEDSLLLAYRATIYNDMGVSYYYIGNYDKVQELWYKAIEDEYIIKDYKGIATAHNNLGQIYLTLGETRKALEEMSKAIAIKKEHGFTDELSINISNLAYCYQLLGDVQGSIAKYNEAMQYADTSKPHQMANILSGLGNVYKRQGKSDMAMQKYQEARKLFDKTDRIYKKAEIINNIGAVHSYYGRYDSALIYYKETIAIYDSLKYRKGKAMASNNVAYIYEKTGRYKEALEILDTTIRINQSLKYIDGLQYNFKIKGDVYKHLGQLDSAIHYLTKAFEYAQKTEILETQFEVTTDLSSIYADLNEWEKAYHFEHQAREIADSIFNSETREAAVRSEMQYEFDKKQLQNKLEQEKKEAIAREKLRQQRYVIISVSVGIVLLLLFFILLFRKFKETSRQKVIIQEANEELNQQNEEIMAQRDQIEEQRQVVQKKNEEILSSIEYAKRIQTAILPPDNVLQSHLPESFVLYKPKDVVAGDFYWLEAMGDTVYFAAADCTGHGVPGAMVSVVCHGALNRCVREYNLRHPADILNKTRELVLDTFKKSEEQVKDGMDICLCTWNKNTGTIEYAGANNPLYILRKEAPLIEIIKADKQPIGFVLKPTPFTNHTLNLEPGDVIYLFSDGFADQFGGPKGKKMGYKRFRSRLEELKHTGIEQQKDALERYFTDWKGQEKQLDDVCVVGVRIN